MEDTDEDFFDKLVDDVDDHFNITSSSSTNATEVANVNHSNEANLSGDGKMALKETGKVGKSDKEDDKGSSMISAGPKEKLTDSQFDPGGSLVTSNLFAFDNIKEQPSNVIGTEQQLDSNVSLYHGTGGDSGVKEVQWSAFTSESLGNSGNEFGSYSDFFTELGDNLVNEIGKGDNFVNNEVNSIVKSSHVDSVNDHSHQLQEGQSFTTSGRQSTDGQDLNNSQYWENLYPGWKYDAKTGQWYQVNEGYDITANTVDNLTSTTSDWTVSNVKSEAAYLQQNDQSFAEEKRTNESITSWSPVSQTSNTDESLSNWNQSSQGNNGYPSHMYFDPQYPGWYYDMNVQEWRALDAYSSQLTTHSQNHLDQNNFSSTNSYYGNEQLHKQSGSDVFGSQGQDYNWNGSYSKQQGSSTWQNDSLNNSGSTSYLRGNQHAQNNYGANFPIDNNVNKRQSYDYGGMSSFNESSQIHNEFPSVSGSQSFVPSGKYSQSFGRSTMEQSEMMNSTRVYGNQNQLSYSQQSAHQSGHQKSYASSAGRSSAGQPPHALVTFGFGGKLIVMKDTSTLINASYGAQDSSIGSISVLNLAETVTGGADVASSGTGIHAYFHTLCRQSFPGPLAGGNVGVKELNRWIDERITHPTDMDYSKQEVIRLLLSLLKIASQHYGKLRSPFGTDTSSMVNLLSSKCC